MTRTLATSAFLFASSLLAMAAAPAGAQTAWTIDSAHSGVQFEIRHLGVSNVRGSLGKVAGTVQLDEKDMSRSSVNATIEADTVTTNQTQRDEHLKGPEFFNVAKFPQLTFKSTSVTNAGGKLKLIGDLTLAGVTKSVTLDLDGPAAPQKGMQGGVVSGFSATGTLHRPDFNFGTKYGPPVLGDDVKFTIDIEMSKK